MNDGIVKQFDYYLFGKGGYVFSSVGLFAHCLVDWLSFCLSVSNITQNVMNILRNFMEESSVITETSDEILVVIQITKLTAQSEVWVLLNKLWVDFDGFFQDSSAIIKRTIYSSFFFFFLPPARFWKRREVLFWGPSPSPRMFCFISRLLLKLAFWDLACAIYAKTILLKCF